MGGNVTAGNFIVGDGNTIRIQEAIQNAVGRPILVNLGVAYKSLGQNGKAREFLNQALEIFRAIESPHVKTVENWLAGLDKE